MTVKEFKEIISCVPDDFEIGFIKKFTTYENWYGAEEHKYFESNINPFVDLKNKRVLIKK